MDFVADGGFLLIIHIAFSKFWWISWISIFRPVAILVNFLEFFVGLCTVKHAGGRW